MQPFLPISHTCISMNHTYIPITPRRQCLTVFNPALHPHDVISLTFLSLHGRLNCNGQYHPLCSSCRSKAESEGKECDENSVLPNFKISLVLEFLPLGVASCCASIQLVRYDAVNPNKVSIQLPLLFSFSLHVSAPTGHLQVRYTIRYP
jgi:hypothetical protein